MNAIYGLLAVLAGVFVGGFGLSVMDTYLRETSHQNGGTVAKKFGVVIATTAVIMSALTYAVLKIW